MRVLGQALLTGKLVSLGDDFALNLQILVVHEDEVLGLHLDVVSRNSLIHGVGRQQRATCDVLEVGQSIAAF